MERPNMALRLIVGEFSEESIEDSGCVGESGGGVIGGIGWKSSALGLKDSSLS